MSAQLGREPDPRPDRRLLRAGQAASTLIADPKSWINRRVETVELLSREETRRRVSVDFSLSDEQLASLWVEGEGVVVPISALSKARRRTFDLSDEGGRAVPVLGLQESRDLTLLALVRAASAALPEGVGTEEFAALIPELRKLVTLAADDDAPAESARDVFHLEIVIPEELRFRDAVLQDFEDPDCRDISANEHDVNRATLYASEAVEPTQDVYAVVQIAPERAGRLAQASLTSIVVAALLWIGAASGLKIESPEATVALVLGGAALYAGITAALGESRLVSMIFKTTRRWLTVVTLAALAGSASLALQVPCDRPVGVWAVAAACCTVAALRLSWSSLRAAV